VSVPIFETGRRVRISVKDFQETVDVGVGVVEVGGDAQGAFAAA